MAKSGDLRGTKAKEREPHIIAMAVLCADNAAEFNKQSAELIKKGLSPVSMAVPHHIEGKGVFYVQRFAQDDKSVDVNPINNLTDQFMIQEYDVHKFNKAIEKAYKDGWEYIDIPPTVRYDINKKSFEFTVTMGKGLRSIIDMPFSDKKVLLPS